MIFLFFYYSNTNIYSTNKNQFFVKADLYSCGIEPFLRRILNFLFSVLEIKNKKILYYTCNQRL